MGCVLTLRRSTALNAFKMVVILMFALYSLSCMLCLPHETWSPDRTTTEESLTAKAVTDPGIRAVAHPGTKNVTDLEIEAGSDLHEAYLGLGTLDSTGDHMVTVFSVVGSSWEELRHRRLGLATHSSVEHLHWIVDTLTTWTGPVSVAIFVPDVDLHVANQFVSHLTACYPSIATQVSFHFVYPVTRPPRTLPGSHPDVGNCSREPTALLKELLQLRPAKMLKWRNDVLYPQNLLRNTARRTLTTQYFICPDVDMIPTIPTLSSELETFLIEGASACVRCAFVVPVYEISRDVDGPPTSKTRLVEYLNVNKARQFHVKVFKYNQLPSSLTLWETLEEESLLDVVYKVKQFRVYYEPVYVADRTAPMFDERFVGFGYTRNSQALEMFMASWDFHVLNNAFLIHWGFQTSKNYSKSRRQQIQNNSSKFKLFIRELALRYDKDPLDLLSEYDNPNTKIIIYAVK